MGRVTTKLPVRLLSIILLIEILLTLVITGITRRTIMLLIILIMIGMILTATIVNMMTNK